MTIPSAYLRSRLAIVLCALTLFAVSCDRRQEAAQPTLTTATTPTASSEAECETVNEGVPQIRKEGAIVDTAVTGDLLTVAGSGFYSPAASVALHWDDVSNTALATGLIHDGCRFSIELIVPPGDGGEHQVIVQLLDGDGQVVLTSSHAILLSE
jgi:hypothetical protein